jgi:hypothetical protein
MVAIPQASDYVQSSSDSSLWLRLICEVYIEVKLPSAELCVCLLLCE